MAERLLAMFEHVDDILRSPHPAQRIRDGLERRIIRFLGKDQVQIYEPEESTPN